MVSRLSYIKQSVDQQSAGLITPLNRIPFWIYPLLLTLFLFFPTQTIPIPFDGKNYMVQAFNLAEGRGYTWIDGTPITYRGPVFSLWLALSFKLFGASDASAFVAVRLFYVLNGLLVYFLTTTLYNRWAGLMAVGLVLTSYGLSDWSTLVHLDILMPALILLYLLVILWAFEKQRLWAFGLAGLILGLNYLLKEVSILYLPFPFLLWLGINTFRTRRSLLGLGLTWLAFLLTIIPWWLHLYQLTGQFLPLGTAGPNVTAPLLTSVQTSGIWKYGQAFVTYYADIMAPNFGLAPILVLAWLGVLGLALWGRPSERILLAAGLCWLPMIVFQGLEGFRARQSVIFFFLSYVALAGIIWAIVQFLSQYSRQRVWLLQATATLLGVGLLVGQLITEEGQWWSVYVPAFNTAGFAAQGGWPSPEDDPSAAWLLQHVEPNSAVLYNDPALASRLYFLTQGQLSLHRIQDAPGLSPAQKKIISILKGTGKGEGILNQTNFWISFEEDLLTTLKSNNIRYIIDPPPGIQSLYYQSTPYLIEVAYFSEADLRIYWVDLDNLAPIDFEMVVGSNVLTFLDELKQQAPSDYDKLKQQLFQETLGLSPAEINQLEAGQFTKMEQQELDYLKLIEARGPQAIEAAITLHQEKADRHPENPWPLITLAKLYKFKGSLAQSVRAYEQALSLEPDNLEALLGLIEVQAEIVQTAQDPHKNQDLTNLVVRTLATYPDNQNVAARIVTVYETLAEAYQKQGDLSLAIATYEEASKNLPEVIEFHLNLARLHQQQSETDKAVAEYEAVLNLEPDQTFVLRAYLGLAESYSQAGDATKALSYYQTARTAFPDTPEVYFRMGLFYEAQEAWAEAVAAYEQAMRLKPAQRWLKAQGFYQLGHLYRQQNRPEEAITTFEQALPWQPKLQTYLELGELYRAQGDIEKMVAVYQKAVTAFPNRPAARLSLAEAYELRGDLDEAIAEYQQVVELTGSNWMFNKAQSRLEALLAQSKQN